MAAMVYLIKFGGGAFVSADHANGVPGESLNVRGLLHTENLHAAAGFHLVQEAEGNFPAWERCAVQHTPRSASAQNVSPIEILAL
jgi:hypothetical protein